MEYIYRILSSHPGTYGPEEGWSSAYPECRERNQSAINIADQDSKVSMEYQELALDGFETESSNKTSMKNTGKTGEIHSPPMSVYPLLLLVMYLQYRYV